MKNEEVMGGAPNYKAYNNCGSKTYGIKSTGYLF